jgi:hypothetical protein
MHNKIKSKASKKIEQQERWGKWDSKSDTQEAAKKRKQKRQPKPQDEGKGKQNFKKNQATPSHRPRKTHPATLCMT